jgi:hypothetical protein
MERASHAYNGRSACRQRTRQGARRKGIGRIWPASLLPRRCRRGHFGRLSFDEKLRAIVEHLHIHRLQDPPPRRRCFHYIQLAFISNVVAYALRLSLATTDVSKNQLDDKVFGTDINFFTAHHQPLALVCREETPAVRSQQARVSLQC